MRTRVSSHLIRHGRPAMPEFMDYSTRRQSSEAHNGQAGNTRTPSFSFGETIKRSHPAHLNWPMTSSPMTNNAPLVVLLTGSGTSMGGSAGLLVGGRRDALRRRRACRVLHQQRGCDADCGDGGEEYDTDRQEGTFGDTRCEAGAPIRPPGRSRAFARIVKPSLAVRAERRLFEQRNTAPMAGRSLGAVMPLAIWLDPHARPPGDITKRSHQTIHRPSPAARSVRRRYALIVEAGPSSVKAPISMTFASISMSFVSTFAI